MFAVSRPTTTSQTSANVNQKYVGHISWDTIVQQNMPPTEALSSAAASSICDGLCDDRQTVTQRDLETNGNFYFFSGEEDSKGLPWHQNTSSDIDQQQKLAMVDSTIRSRSVSDDISSEAEEDDFDPNPKGYIVAPLWCSEQVLGFGVLGIHGLSAIPGSLLDDGTLYDDAITAAGKGTHYPGAATAEEGVLDFLAKVGSAGWECFR